MYCILHCIEQKICLCILTAKYADRMNSYVNVSSFIKRRLQKHDFKEIC